MRQVLTLLLTILLLGGTNLVFAADDPSITGKPRISSQEAMSNHIEKNQLDSSYVIYDAVIGQLLELELVELHSGIVKKGDYYVSCADFVDAKGNKYDLDFIVAENGSEYIVYDAIVHKVNKDKRKYHLDH
ncbi:MAG: hypothetical protein DHS20C13_04520 [Thermodesulfobacteriota bacterium]|nr:MAG: hypothetical protein DHS20C13_04520 [Thermodesulfobacteriota bacterium]